MDPFAITLKNTQRCAPNLSTTHGRSLTCPIVVCANEPDNKLGYAAAVALAPALPRMTGLTTLNFYRKYRMTCKRGVYLL